VRIRFQSMGIAVALVSGVLVSTAPAAAQSDTGVQPLVAIAARVVADDGTTKGGAGSDPDPFIAGKPLTSYIFTGLSGAGADALCSLGSSNTTSRTLEELIETRAHVWKVTVTPVDYQAAKEKVDVDWTRYEAGSGGRPVASGRQRLLLLQGQRSILDLVHAQPGARCAHVELDVVASAKEDAAFADTVLQYDVWLVHRDPAGRKDSRHMILTGLQGSELPFDFAPLRFDVPKFVAGQYDYNVAAKVRGHIRGRLGPDGNITLEVGTTRMNALALRGEFADPPIAGEGRKILQVKPGEAVEIELPSWSGFSGRYASPADAEAGKGTVTRIGVGGGTGAIGGARGAIKDTKTAEPISYSGGRIVVTFPRFFDGHQFSMIVQAKKLNDD